MVEARKKLHFTQQDLANRVGVTRQMISVIERGEQRPSPEVAKKIAMVLGFDWTKFFEEPNPVSDS